MRKLTDILRLKHQGGLSHAKIAAALGLSKGVVGKYVSLANAKGIAWPLPEGLDEAALERLLFASPAKAGRFAEPDFHEIHQELKRKGVTLQLLWGEYAATHGQRALRYSQFCERYRRWRAAQRRSMRQHHRGRLASVHQASPGDLAIGVTLAQARQDLSILEHLESPLGHHCLLKKMESIR